MTLAPAFCSACGGKLAPQFRDGRVRPVCSSCGRVVYQNPVPSVAAVLMREGRVLLVKRNIEPGLGLWGLPGGFVELGESLGEAVAREVEEETGLTCKPEFIVAAHSVFEAYYGDLIVICFYAKILGGELCAGCDASEVAEFHPQKLPALAFDTHAEFIQRYLDLLASHEHPHK